MTYPAGEGVHQAAFPRGVRLSQDRKFRLCQAAS